MYYCINLMGDEEDQKVTYESQEQKIEENSQEEELGLQVIALDGTLISV